MASFDVDRIRLDFPLLSREVCGRPIVYFDNAATALKPQVVVDSMVEYLTHSTANIHRGKHLLSQEASIAYEAARERVARFLGVEARATIFVRGATEAINIVAAGLRLERQHNVVGTILEHHSNILPWRMRCGFRAVGLDERGLPDVEEARSSIDADTRLLAVTHCSNVTGAYVPLAPWRALATDAGIPLLVDAAQSGAHADVRLKTLGADYVALSGHKMCGPPGAGVLYGRVDALEKLDPPALGGGTVSMVGADGTYTLRDLPWRLEPGTPDIAAVIGLGAAVQYLETLDREGMRAHLATLRSALDEVFAGLDGVDSVAPAAGVERACVQSFNEASGTFPADYLTRLLSDTYGIMARAGHHCAHPLHETLGVAGTARVSLHLYNTVEEVKHLGDAMASIVAMTR